MNIELNNDIKNLNYQLNSMMARNAEVHCYICRSNRFRHSKRNKCDCYELNKLHQNKKSYLRAEKFGYLLKLHYHFGLKL